jgi:prepilin peptidase CpaA
MPMIYEYSPTVFQWGAVVGASLIAACTDLRCRRIPNVLTIPLFFGGLIYAAQAGGWQALSNALLAALLAALPFVLLFVFCGGGAGDAKLMGAIGAWLGLQAGVVALAAVCIAGAGFAILHACFRRQLLATLARVGGFGKAVMLLVFGGVPVRDLPSHLPMPAESQTIPYGVAILVGTTLAAGISL